MLERKRLDSWMMRPPNRNRYHQAPPSGRLPHLLQVLLRPFVLQEPPWGHVTRLYRLIGSSL